MLVICGSNKTLGVVKNFLQLSFSVNKKYVHLVGFFQSTNVNEVFRGWWLFEFFTRRRVRSYKVRSFGHAQTTTSLPDPRVLSTFLVALTFITPRSPHASNSYNKHILVVMKISTPIKALAIIK